MKKSRGCYTHCITVHSATKSKSKEAPTADASIVRVSSLQAKSMNGAITTVEAIRLRYAQNVALTPYLEMPHLWNLHQN